MPCPHQLIDDEMCEHCPPASVRHPCAHQAGTYRRDGETADRCLKCSRPVAIAVSGHVTAMERPVQLPEGLGLETLPEARFRFDVLACGTPDPTMPFVLAALQRDDVVRCADALQRVAQRTLNVAAARIVGDHERHLTAQLELCEAENTLKRIVREALGRVL